MANILTVTFLNVYWSKNKVHVDRLKDEKQSILTNYIS